VVKSKKLQKKLDVFINTDKIESVSVIAEAFSYGLSQNLK
jgi:hypothetical protein